MLPVDESELVIPANEYYNRETREFISIPEQRLRLKHSLVSISKWEAKWKEPFLSKKPKTREQSLDYIKLMTITQNVNPLVYEFLPDNLMDKVQEYIDDPMTATIIRTQPKPGGQKIITSEVIYSWMVSYRIDKEYEKWHLNRLLTLIKILSIENSPKKKMNNNSVYSRNDAINAARRAKMNSKG